MIDEVTKRIVELDGYTVGEIVDIINDEFNTSYDAIDIVNRIQSYYEVMG